MQVRTYREGVAQKVGHDLIIDVELWQATVELAEDGQPHGVVLDADARSLQVLEGRNGLKPLSDRDRAEILKNVDQKILRGQPIAFRSTAIERDDGRLTFAATSRSPARRGRPASSSS